MTRILTLTIAAAATPALADPGHIVEAGGHSHWELLIGLAVIAALALPMILRAVRRRR